MERTIKRLKFINFKEFKLIRLEALKNEPLAFGESYESVKLKDKKYWKDELNGKYQIWYAVFIDNEIAAICSIKFGWLTKFKHIARFSGVYVKKDFRGRGIAKIFFNSLINKTFAKSEIQKIRLTVNKTQKPALALYRSFGFKKVGNLIKEFKINGKYYDAYLMELLR